MTNTPSPKVIRWQTGTKNLSQIWTEFVGRVMKHDQTPEDVYRNFDVFFNTGQWPVR